MPRLRTLCGLLTLLLPFTANADSLSDLKSAVGRMTARQPVRATFAADLSVQASGKLANDSSQQTVALQVTHDSAGITITIPQPLVDRARNRDEKAQGAIDAIRAASAVEALDYRGSLLELLNHSKLVEEKRLQFRGKPARQLVLSLDVPRRKRNEIVIGKVKTIEDRMSIWVSDDHLPLAAERFRKSTAGFLMFHATSQSRTNMTFTVSGDRLILARLETSSGGSALGTKIDEASVQTMTLH